MAIPFITPVGGNFLKDFSGQNAVNMDLIDEAAGPCLATSPLQSYVPVLTAVTASPGLGATGFIKGNYYKIFDEVFVWGEFRFKTGFSAGSGIYIVTLPFPVSSSINPDTDISVAPVLGSGLVWCNVTTADRQPLTAHLRTSTQLMFGIKIVAAGTVRELTHNNPITWAVDDGLSWCVRYRRSS